MVRLADAYGLDGKALALDSGIELATLHDPDGRVDVAQSDDLIERVDGLANDPRIGVRLAAMRDASTYDAAGIALLGARTLRLGLSRAFRCQVLWGDGERFAIARDTISFDPGPAHRRAHEIVTECALVEIASGVAALAGSDAKPRRAAFGYDVGARVKLLEAALRCPVESRARRSAIVFEARHLDARIPGGVIQMFGLFAPRKDASFAAAVEDVAARALVAGDASLVGVATRFDVSARTLQRKLAAENATFEDIVDGARRALARSLLSKGVAIGEIGALLGYADKAAFYRAFRRWTGTTPDAARRAAALA